MSFEMWKLWSRNYMWRSLTVKNTTFDGGFLPNLLKKVDREELEEIEDK